MNGDFSPVGHPAVHYLHQSFPKEEMAAFYLAADVALVTPLRDGMNLVAKEYVACRYDLGGRLVLSEFTGAANELTGAFLVNPHDIDSLKARIMAAMGAPRAGGNEANATFAQEGLRPRCPPVGRRVPGSSGRRPPPCRAARPGGIEPNRIGSHCGRCSPL